MLLGGVDGFDQDERAGEGNEGSEVLGGLLAAQGDAFEAFELADGLFDAGISMSAGLFMVRSFVCYANHPNAPMLQESHLKGSVRLEATITIARYGRTTGPSPQRALAMTVLFVVNSLPA